MTKESLLTVILIAAAAPLQAQTQSYTLHMLQDVDTISTEQVTRTPDRLDVDLLLRQQQIRYAFSVDLGSDGRVQRVTNHFFRDAANSEPDQMLVATFAGDSATVDITADGTRTVTVPAPDVAMPWILPSNALIEQGLIIARSLGDQGEVAVFNLANAQIGTLSVDWQSADRATVDFAEARMTAEMRGDGLLDRLVFRRGGRYVVRVDHP